jgi:hypothetical protein
MKNTFLSIVFVCFIVLSFFSGSSLAIMKGLSTEELTNASDTVIEGEVGNTEAQWSKDGQTIFTSADVVIHTIIKGKSSKTKVRVEYEGGEVGEIGLKVSDQPALIQGEKVILFLKAEKSKQDGDAYSIVGKSQGKYAIDADGIARKGGFSIADGQEDIDNNIPADALIRKIKEIKRE